MTQVTHPVEGTDPLTRVEAFLAAQAGSEHPAAAGTLRLDDLRALTHAAHAAAHLEAENATLRAAEARRARTGALLVQARANLDVALETIAEIEDLATRHHRGDPYGVQGAAAQQILDVIAHGPAAGAIALRQAAALDAAARALSEEAGNGALAAVVWLTDKAARLRAEHPHG